MSFERLPSNSEKLLLQIIATDNPSELLRILFEKASRKEKEKLRGIMGELRRDGYINVKWADNIPYFVTINNAARTYKEELFELKNQDTKEPLGREKVDTIIFISHRSIDKEIADMLVDFLTATGIEKNKIFCSSLPGNDINEKISKEVKTALQNSVVNIAILSKDYYQSAFCLNEAGILWYQNTPVIPIALPEIDSRNMYGFLNSEYKLRHLDSETDISYIYDTICDVFPEVHTKVSIITYETNKLKKRYNEFLKVRKSLIPDNISAPSDIISEITTDDERVVLYYILENNVRKITKDAVLNWLHKNEIYGINIDNAFDLLSSLSSDILENDTLEIGLELFRKYSSNKDFLLADLKRFVDKHIVVAAETFCSLWSTDIIDETIKLFTAYIVDEKMSTFGDRWMADGQIENIKSWESKNSLDSALSENYGSCLQFFVTNNLVYDESSWTSYGNPREFSLCTSLQEFLFNCPPEYKDALQEVKNAHFFDLPF